MENSTYEEIESNFEQEFELNSSEAQGELQINTATPQATQRNSEAAKPFCHHCEKPGCYQNQCRQLKREKNQAQNNENSAGNNDNSINGHQTNSIFNKNIPDCTNQK